jgi:hypothetical protein
MSPEWTAQALASMVVQPQTLQRPFQDWHGQWHVMQRLVTMVRFAIGLPRAYAVPWPNTLILSRVNFEAALN